MVTGKLLKTTLNLFRTLFILINVQINMTFYIFSCYFKHIQLFTGKLLKAICISFCTLLILFNN